MLMHSYANKGSISALALYGDELFIGGAYSPTNSASYMLSITKISS